MGIASIFKMNSEFDWSDFSREVNGEHTVLFGEERVVFSIEGQVVVFDNYTHFVSTGNRSHEKQYSRIQIEFVPNTPFKLKIVRQDILESIAKFFGAQDIRIGNEVFDKRYMIQSNDENIAMLLLDDSICQFVLQQSFLRFEITDGKCLFDEEPAAGKYLVYLISEGRIQSDESLRLRYQFVENLLLKMKRMILIRG